MIAHLHRFQAITIFAVMIVMLTALAGITGCSTANPTTEYIGAVEQNKHLDTGSLYKEVIEKKGLDVELCLMEKGRIAQIQGDFNVSRMSFNEQVEILKQRELDDNTLPATQVNTGSVLINDNMLPYKARLFESEMIYLYQSFNYLAKGDMEGAVVEIRNADFLLNEAEKARESKDFKERNFRNYEEGIQKKLFESQKVIQDNSKAKQYAAKNNVESASEAKFTQDDEKYFTERTEDLAKSKSSVLNPYVIYVGGIIHEMSGDLDNAYISYKKGLDVMPSNPYLRRDIVRLARKLNKIQDLDKLKSTYPEIWKQLETSTSDKNGRLVVLYEYGWVQRKKEAFITKKYLSVAYPVYQFKWCDASPMLISAEQGELGSTAPICYMNTIALRALKEDVKWRRIMGVTQLQVLFHPDSNLPQPPPGAIKVSEFAAGTPVGNSNVRLASGFLLATSAICNKNANENADLRSFMTLPENVQTLAADIPAGTHKIAFAPQGTQLRLEESVPVIAGKTTIVRVVQVGPRLIYQQLWPAVAPAVKSNTDHAEAQSNKPQEGNKL